MKRLSGRYLLTFTTGQLWELLGPEFIIVFDDGKEIQVDAKSVLYSSYFWDLHRAFPQTPLFERHHVRSVLDGGYLTSKTHIRLLENIYWDVVAAYNLHTPSERDRLTKMVYEVTNELYNDLARRAESSVASIDILDFISVVDHPDVKSAIESLNYGTELNPDYGRSSINTAYERIMTALQTSPSLQNNSLAQAVRSEIANNTQVLQCVGPRGFLTHVDSVLMPVPVLDSFTSGMRTLYNIMAESQSSAKNLYFSESPLQDSEYFARRLQLMSMVVERLYSVDCGSTEYLLWTVKGPVMSGDTTVYPGDIKFLVGKYYLDEDTGKLKEIKKGDSHLNGKTIKIRSVLGCQHPDPHGVCEVCFGRLADNLTPEANLGHVCAATLTKQTTQSVLSTKHILASSSTEPIVLSQVGKRFFNVGKEGNTFFLNNEVKTKKMRMMVSQDEAIGLTDIMLFDEMGDINPSRISDIEVVGFEESTPDGYVVTPVFVRQHDRYAMLTLDFLQYLKEQRWEQDNRGNFIFEFQNWDITKPVMVLPEMEYSYSMHSHQVADVIESKMKVIGDRMKPESPAKTLTELFELVNSKLNVNLALLEVIIYATMIRDGLNDDFGLARNSPNRSLGVSDITLRNRSLSAAYSYEKQLNLITNPRSFYKLNRPDSVFDCFICPREVVNAYKKR